MLELTCPYTPRTSSDERSEVEGETGVPACGPRFAAGGGAEPRQVRSRTIGREWSLNVRRNGCHMVSPNRKFPNAFALDPGASPCHVPRLADSF